MRTSTRSLIEIEDKVLNDSNFEKSYESKDKVYHYFERRDLDCEVLSS